MAVKSSLFCVVNYFSLLAMELYISAKKLLVYDKISALWQTDMSLRMK